MHPSSAEFFLMLLAATACSVRLVTYAQQQPRPASHIVHVMCIPDEREALLSFKQGITSDPAGLLDSWQHDDGDCCRWRGVRCGNRTGHVLKLLLVNGLGGYENNYEDTALVGQISPSLLALRHLKHLDLSWNFLEGPHGRIPEFLGSLNELKYLNLSGIPFHGMLPPQLGNLSNMQYLDLSNMGGTYSTDVSWTTHLGLLQYLDLGSVNLHKITDWPHMVNMFPSLRVLYLSGCSLTRANQSVPRLNLTNLEKLDLSYNYFEHPIASSWFWNITHLQELTVGSTSLYGQIPSVLENMTSLKYLDISQQSDERKPRCIMQTSLRNLCNLEGLYLEGKLLYGDITELLKSLPHCSSNKLTELFLSDNNISGVLPTHMGHLTSLVYLDLSSNNISGRLPGWMGQLTSLVLLDLSQNNITGPLPSFVGNFTNLIALHLYSNHMSGHMPYEVRMLSNLIYLNLHDNGLDGLVTQEHLDGLKSLQYIYLSSNFLKIETSREWQPPFKLKEAYFASCEMGPLFPPWLKWMVGIEYLNISNTHLNDRLPDWFCSSFSKAKDIDITSNQVHGGLPANMEHMSVEKLFFGSNQLTGPIPPMPLNLTTLDLSGNLLSGPLQ